MFSPTSEQQDALAAFGTGKSLAIEAGAGAGKTSTLRLLAEGTPRRGQYIAFNRAIVDESKQKMPARCACNTAHALAFRAVGKHYAHRLKSPRMKSTELARRLGVEAIRVTLQDGTTKNLAATYLAGVVMKSVTRFCQSADEQPMARHVPYINGIDVPPGRRENNGVVANALVPYMRRAWKDLMDVKGSLPYQHDHYLKAYQLSNPRIWADYILFDEAQDANPVMVAIVAAQQHAQLVFVGDSQQQIYSFTGAVNALETVPAEQRTFLTQSFRFGPAIATVANRVLNDLNAQLRITGTESIPSVVREIDQPDVYLSRTNAAAVRRVLDALKDGLRPHLVGGGKDVVSFAKAAQLLIAGERVEHPELACFESWSEVQDYVEQDEQGGDLKLLVNLIDDFTAEVIIEALDQMPTEADADIVVSTAHKAKGREWDTVKLADDFPDQPKDEELRLLYVAVTRARLALDITSVGYLNSPSDSPPEAVSATLSLEDFLPGDPAPVDSGTDSEARDAAREWARTWEDIDVPEDAPVEHVEDGAWVTVRMFVSNIEMGVQS